MKITEVIEKIEAWHEPFVANKTGHGRDGIKYGDPEQECTGIAVSICATFEVVKKAAEMGINLIITHESIFYGKEDDYADVYKEKMKYMDEHGIVVYRDHDRMHGNGKPFFPERKRNDYIFYGIMKELGWDAYVIGDQMKPLLYEIPEIGGRDLYDFLKEKFEVSGMRIVGNIDSKIRRVFFCEHVGGGKGDLERLPTAIEADAIIPMEICDYTLSAYVKDCEQLEGKNKVIYEMGHFNVEALGMKYMLQWLPEAVGNEIRIEYIRGSDTYQYMQ